MKKVTIRDVAKAAGVSPSTVSRALSTTDRVSSETTRRIIGVAERLGYRLPTVEEPTAAVQTESSSHLIGIVVPDVTDQYAAAIVHSVENECFGHGYGLVIAESRDSVAWERMVLEKTMSLVDGVIMVAPRMANPMLRDYADAHPLVVTNRNVRNVTSIVVDISTGIGQAADLFAVRGRTRVTYLSGPNSVWASGARLRELQTACERKGLDVVQLWPGEPTFEGGAAYVDKYLEDPTGAVLAYNDAMALGFMARMRERGFECPRDYLIVGFNDDVTAQTSTPPLSSIRMSANALGVNATRLLLRRMAGGVTEDFASYAAVPSSLAVRDSLGGFRGNPKE